MYKVSVITYLNSIPFMYGLLHSDVSKYVDLHFDTPAVCAQNLIEGRVDIGIVPVAVLPQIPNARTISRYAIGAVSAVRTVALFSNTPLQHINQIYLDRDSRTSNLLAQVLAQHFWNIQPIWHLPQADTNPRCLKNGQAQIVIGDRVFETEGHFNFNYDLAQQWIHFTNRPFVFALWVANRTLESDFVERFNAALEFGISNIKAAVEAHYRGNLTTEQALRYLSTNISYLMDNQKNDAISLFYKYIHVENNPHLNFTFNN